MLAIVISLLFGLIATAALLQIHASLRLGLRRGRLILAELSDRERALKPRSGRRTSLAAA